MTPTSATWLIAVLGLVTTGVTVAREFAEVTKLVTFDGAAATTYNWKDLNDPVMGGRSFSTYTIDNKQKRTALWKGEVKIVPSLKAPGFCNAETTNIFRKFADVTGHSHILLHVKSSTPEYKGFKFSFAADTLNPQFASFKAPFKVKKKNEWETVAIPFGLFSKDWSSYTGRCDTKDPTGKQHHCCTEEHPEVCVKDKNLKDISQVGLWTEGEAGVFDLEVAWIGAGKGSLQSSSRNTCKGKVQEDLRFNVSGRIANDYLVDGAMPFESLATAVCCDSFFKPYAEPSGFFARPDVELFKKLDISIEADGTAIFYDSVCGLPLFNPPQKRTMADFEAETIEHGWPSFRREEIIDNNVRVLDNGDVVSVCGTRLGSNLPDEKGDRLCLDLVCISGNPIDTQPGILISPLESRKTTSFRG